MSLPLNEDYTPEELEKIYDGISSPDNDTDNLNSENEVNESKKSLQEENKPCSDPPVGPFAIVPSRPADNYNLQDDTSSYTASCVTQDSSGPENQGDVPLDVNDIYVPLDLDAIDVSFDLDEILYMEEPSGTRDEQYALAAGQDTVLTNVSNAETTQLNAAAVKTIYLNPAAEKTNQSISTVDVSGIASSVTFRIPSAVEPTAEFNTSAAVTSNKYVRPESRPRKSSLGSRRVTEEVKDTSPTVLGREQQRTQRPRRTATKRKQSASPEIPQSSNPRSCKKIPMWQQNTPEAKNARLAHEKREEKKIELEEAKATIKSLTEENAQLKGEVKILKEENEGLLKFKQAHKISLTRSVIMMDIIEKFRSVAEELTEKLPPLTHDANNMN